MIGLSAGLDGMGEACEDRTMTTTMDRTCIICGDEAKSRCHWPKVAKVQWYCPTHAFIWNMWGNLVDLLTLGAGSRLSGHR